MQCTTAVLTVPSSEMDPEGQATVESLARFQQAKSITAAGSLVRYALSRESVTVLQEATGGPVRVAASRPPRQPLPLSR